MLDAVYGAVAVELGTAAQPRLLIERPQTNALANALAAELARHLPSLDGLGLCWMAGCFDVAQLLRPGWPIFNELKQLYQAGVRDPFGEPQILSLSALRQQAPSAVLSPDPGLLGGSLVYLPFALIGAPDIVAAARTVLEERLLEQGLLDARSARMLIDALGVPVEHARLLTRDDLCALSAANLENAGLGCIWQAIEVALFHPGRSLDFGDADLRCSVIDGCVHLHFSADERLDSGISLAARVLLLRQAIAVLQAHQLPWRILPSRALQASTIEQDDAGFWIEWPGDPRPLAVVNRILDAQSQLLWLELLDAAGQVCGHGFPLHTAGLRALQSRLQQDSGMLIFGQRMAF